MKNTKADNVEDTQLQIKSTPGFFKIFRVRCEAIGLLTSGGLFTTPSSSHACPVRNTTYLPTPDTLGAATNHNRASVFAQDLMQGMMNCEHEINKGPRHSHIIPLHLSIFFL